MAYVTLLDISHRLDPDGSLSDMAEMLSQANEPIEDMPMVEANGPTSHTVTLRTALPKGAYIQYYQGAPFTKSLGAQVVFGMSRMRAYSRIDKALAELGGDPRAVRAQEDDAHMEGLSQQQCGTLFYGNANTSPAQFSGLSAFYATAALANAQNAVNVFDCGGTGSSNASLWVLGMGEQTVHGIYPKGVKAGLLFEDRGDIVPGLDSTGAQFEAFTTLFEWTYGLVVRDWRYAIRLCNIDTTTAGLLGPTPPDLFAILSRAVYRLPAAARSISGVNQIGSSPMSKKAPGIRLKMYMGRTLRAALDIQAIRDKNVLLSPTDYAGQPVLNFRNIPRGTCDQLLSTEARVI